MKKVLSVLGPGIGTGFLWWWMSLLAGGAPGAISGGQGPAVEPVASVSPSVDSGATADGTGTGTLSASGPLDGTAATMSTTGTGTTDAGPDADPSG